MLIRGCLWSVLMVTIMCVLTSCMSRVAVVEPVQQQAPQGNSQPIETAEPAEEISIEITDVAVQEEPVAAPRNETETPAAVHDVMIIETNKGAIHVQLDAESAPVSVANIKRYAENGFYDGTVFHRVIEDFMIQGGGFAADPNSKKFVKKPTGKAIQNESSNGLRNLRGTVAMARTSNPHSATSQFYINLVNNAHLDAQGERLGYAVFGRVVKGMDVVDAIGLTPTTRGDWPSSPIVMTKVHIIGSQTAVEVEEAVESGPMPVAAPPSEAVETEKTEEVDYFGVVTSFTAGNPSVLNISVGSDDGIQKGDVLLIKQDGKIRCTATVTRVASTKAIAVVEDADWSAGINKEIATGSEVDLK